MSPREKNLLLFMGGILFLMGNVFAYTEFYSPAMQKAKDDKFNAKNELETANTTLRLAPILEPDIAWLKRTGEATSTPQQAQSKLQTLLRKQANAANLETRNSDILPFVEGTHFTRVRVLYKVTGMEQDLFNWLTRVHQVNQRQVVTKMMMKPASDITRIECEIEIEKWIILPTDES